LSNKSSFRVVAFSDTHGSFRAANRILRKTPDADLYIFLGDGEKEIEQVKALYPKKQVISVMGNCDSYSNAPKELVYTVPDGRKIFCAHGHEYSVGFSMDNLYYRAREVEATVALFGHTHQRYYTYADGLYIINPGSAACPRDGLYPSYAIIDFADGGVVCSHVELK
jgi:putative phosphoesterase